MSLESLGASCKQAVKASLPTSPDNVLVLPFDLCGDYAELEKAAAAADAAFDGAGVDYLVHNAGAQTSAARCLMQCCPLHWLGKWEYVWLLVCVCCVQGPASTPWQKT